ncbi:MAG TPA: AI-2E family transporter, partial [Thiotrichales bacterium]|nr:AI-2E family transporter [Thiotrichales bacterium]
MSNANQGFSPASRILLVTAAVVIIITGIKLAAPLLVPFLLSVFIAVISFPAMCKLQQKGLGDGISLFIVIFVVFLTGAALALLVGTSLESFGRAVPAYQAKLSGQWQLIIDWLNSKGLPVSETISNTFNPSAAMGFVASILKGFGNVLANSFLIFLTVIFILIEARGLAQKLQAEKRVDAEPHMSEVFAEKLRAYMSIKTLVSLFTGILVAVFLWVMGVDYPALWGVLAFMLNFVPNIGSIIAAIPAVILALVQTGPLTAAIVTAAYVMINIGIGSVLEPKLMGKGLGLSTLVVFVSLVFWGW